MELTAFFCFFTLLYKSTFAGSFHNALNNSNKNVEDTKKEESWRKEHWIELPLDHFNLFDNRTWKMRYFMNEEFFQKDMPLFIEIGGEWTVNATIVTERQLYLLAKTHKGLLVATEHRYYGKSLPFPIEFPTENLGFLQIEQALEDLVYLIEYLKLTIPGLQNSKVVVHGCSYAGMLASWVRSRFPNIVDIAYASSAPLGVELDYPEYYQTVNDVYANVSVSCIDTIRKGFNDTERMLKTEDGSKVVKDALRNWNCGDIDNMSSTEIIWRIMLVLNVQYDPVQYEEISCLVMAMDTEDLSEFERLANLVVLKSKDADPCTFEGSQQAHEVVAWISQTCTEIGFFQTINRNNPRHPFPLESTVKKSVDECVQLFGKKVTEQLIRTGIERTIRRYGGKYLKVTKLLTVHGTADPWRVPGISEEINPEAPVIILRGSHCVDNVIRKDDPPELIKSRETIRNVISKWIDQISS